jgi:hypothetical protein
MSSTKSKNGIQADAAAKVNESVLILSNALQSAGEAILTLTNDLHGFKALDTEERWVRMWGETLPKKDASKMLGISVGYLNKLVGNKHIDLTPDGRVLVRSAASWALEGTQQKPNTKRTSSQRWRVEA